MGIFFHYITTGGTSMGELQPKLQTDSIQKQEWTDNWFARAMNIRIGIIPLPIYILLFLLITVFVMSRDVKSDILTSIAVMSFFGFTFGQIGKSIPIVRSSAACDSRNLYSIRCRLLPPASERHYYFNNRIHGKLQLSLSIYCRYRRRQYSRDEKRDARQSFR